jgi:hypothetical protein
MPEGRKGMREELARQEGGHVRLAEVAFKPPPQDCQVSKEVKVNHRL